jgi:predicted enzyme related to lactoylglutathione lyase
MPTNLIQHHEWNTRDPERLKKFYGKIFDWTFDDSRMPGYTLIDGIGGIFPIPPEMGEMPAGITNYVNVDDLDAKEKLLRELGATIYISKKEVPNMGWFTIFADPDGNTIAMWQAMAQ